MFPTTRRYGTRERQQSDMLVTLSLFSLIPIFGVFMLVAAERTPPPPAEPKPVEVWCESGEQQPTQAEYGVWESICTLDDGIRTTPIKVIMVD